MGGGGSKPRPAAAQNTQQRQANNNKIIDQSTDSNALLQFNWASFGSGMSSIIIIGALIVLLLYCWRQNKKANKKTHSAQLHEFAAIVGHGGAVPYHDSAPPPRPTVQYPGQGGYPGSPPPGPLPSGMPALNASGMPGVNSGAQLGLPGYPAIHQQQLAMSNMAQLSGLANLAASLPDWSRIQELAAPRTRVSFLDEMPTPILRRASSRRNLNEGASSSASAGRPAGAPTARSPQIQALLDRIEAEENAAAQLG